MAEGITQACEVRSSVTDASCVLDAGHPPDSATRFHRFPRLGPYVGPHRHTLQDCFDQMGAATDHPEERCDRCGRPNVWSWHAPSPLWNAVMRDPATGRDRYGIVCPPCFAELAEAAGVVPAKRHTWHFAAEGIDIASLWTDRDGRAWDPERCLWIAPAGDGDSA